METASVSLHASFSLSNRFNRSQVSPTSIIKPLKRNSTPSLQFRDHHLRSEPAVRQQASSISAVVGDTAAIPKDFTEEQPSSSGVSDSDQTSTSVEKDSQTKSDPQNVDKQKTVIMCDKLIGVFMVDKPTPKDWRKLLAFSRTWNNIRPHFFKRVQERADAENNPEMKHKLLRFGRKLKEIDEDVQRHNDLIEVIKDASADLNAIIARRRKDFTLEFFTHLYFVTESYHDNPEEQNALAKLASTCMAVVEAYDTESEDIQAVNNAKLKFEDIIKSPNLDVACRKIDSLAEKNQLDPALVLMISKAWSAAKETTLMKDEAKDIMYHLYTTAVANLQRLVPKDIRILKFLLTVEDPKERLSSLRDAFTPGDETEGVAEDSLYTTPLELHSGIKTVLDAYYNSKEGTLVWQAKDLMNPTIIQKMEVLKKEIEDNFL